MTTNDDHESEWTNAENAPSGFWIRILKKDGVTIRAEGGREGSASALCSGSLEHVRAVIEEVRSKERARRRPRSSRGQGM